MGLEVPKSANSNSPAQRPLPDVDPQWLLMAAAHMQSIGKFDPFTGSAYAAESKFSDAEMSKNLEDRRGDDPYLTHKEELERLAKSVDSTVKSASNTPTDLSLEERSMTATARGSARTTTPR